MTNEERLWNRIARIQNYLTHGHFSKFIVYLSDLEQQFPVVSTADTKNKLTQFRHELNALCKGEDL